MLYSPVRPPKLFKWLMPTLTWQIKDAGRMVYLSFDDGPIPTATDWVLDLLAEYKIKSTFFCIGKNVEANPELYQRIITEGHRVGNHTQTHPSGWEVSYDDYISNYEQANRVIDTDLFRPPYGKITPKLARRIRRDKQIVMWSVLSCDFDINVPVEKVISNVLDNLSDGAIIVMHDSLKASPNLKGSLRIIIEGIKEQGYECGLL